MATNFLSRWSKRKLGSEAVEKESDHAREPMTLAETQQSESIESQVNDQDTVDALERSSSVDATTTTGSALAEEANEAEATEPDTQDPEEMSLANLLVSQVEESAKKAAMRKMFMSAEFNIRDGLDDYDEDYSNLKTLSQGVAETLREWVKEKPEEAAEQNATSDSAFEQEDGTLSDDSITEESSDNTIVDSEAESAYASDAEPSQSVDSDSDYETEISETSKQSEPTDCADDNGATVDKSL
ncbi:hypothetical protein VII00023_10769 [Vibrio ichthyoenteri ATCC 700023]|uniref:DUF3306 domain-containing protein n=1 Tax=Vibrio ichthyoenteri ATCC 700023 TaxID=870968 RepID=F9S809_9VIBR|nr:DUF3306 domain-containing protein [Vibrio ichthyoenteri]EGU30486.1 hypothetical protein VII00023_10769 [Vibrio ichthyoenteri ATCC 700023]